MLYDIIIVGGGPAGITAGIYAARKLLKTLLLTKDFFGQVAKTGRIDNWPGEFGIRGMALMQKLEQHLRQFSIEIQVGENVQGVKLPAAAGSLTPCTASFMVQTESGKEFVSKALIVATGRSPKMLGIPGEKEFIGKGVSFCSICDAPFFKDKRVAIVGGGNAGFGAALDLIQYAKQVFVFERENEIRADGILVEQAIGTGKVQIELNKELKKIEGNGKVEALVYQDLVTHKTFQLPIEGVFVLVGSAPATAFLKGLVDLNKDDEIKVEMSTFQSSVPGIFAPGDVNAGKCRQIVIAAGQGAQAALSAYEYLQKL